MLRKSVALTSGFTSVLSLLDLDTSGPITVGLSAGETATDTFVLWGTLDSAATNTTNAQQLGMLSGDTPQDVLTGIAYQARFWPYLFLQRTGGTTAGTFYVTGNEVDATTVASVTAPSGTAFSSVLNLTAYSASGVRIGGTAAMTADDVFDVFLTEDSTVTSAIGCVYAGRITGGGGTRPISVITQGWPYAIVQRVAGTTAGNLLAAGIVAPTSGPANAWVQDGNAFGAIGVLGTTDAQAMTIMAGSSVFANAASGADGQVILGRRGLSNTTVRSGTGGVTVTTDTTGNIQATTGSTGTVTIDSGTTGSVSVGTGITGAGKTCSVGSLNGTSTTNLNAGSGGIAALTVNAGPIAVTSDTTGNVSLDSGTTGDVSVGTGVTGAGKTVALGNNNGTTSTSVRSGTGGLTVNAATSGNVVISTGSTGSVSLDSGTTGDVNVGTGIGGAGKNVSVGNTNGTTALALSGGSSGIQVVTTGNATVTAGQGGNGNLGLTSTGNGNIALTPGASAAILLLPRGVAAGDTAELHFRELAASGANATGFKAPDALGTNIIYTLPNAFPTANGQVLSCTIAGVLSWFAGTYVYATNTSGQSIPDAAVSTVLTNWTEVVDTANAFNPTTGIFTVPVSGRYLITTEIEFTSIAANLNSQFSVGVYVDGVAFAVGREYVQVAGAVCGRNPKLTSGPVTVTAGQQIAIRAIQDSGSGANTLSTVGLRNFLGIMLLLP